MNAKGRILIVDDEKDIRFLLKEILEDEGFSVAEAAHSEAAYADIALHGMPDLVILDIWLENSDRDGMEILTDLKKRAKTLPVLMISGHGNIEMAVKAIKLGAFDFIEKPFKTERLLQLVGRALDAPLGGKKAKAAVARAITLVAHTPEMQTLQKAAQKAAAGDGRVLICGAWAAGRTHLARYIHQESPRAAKALSVVACASLESAQMADVLSGEGSVVLRDVHMLSHTLQADLLARLNGRPEARVMAVAGNDLAALSQQGRFLPDLYQRLAVTVLSVPSLEDRRGDLAALAADILRETFERWGERVDVQVHEDAAADLRGRSWGDGQLHALRVVCAQAALRMHAQGAQELRLRHLATAPDANAASVSGPLTAWTGMDLRAAREDFERWYFEQLMARFDGNVSQVAAFAGMDRTALHRKLKALKEGDNPEAAA